MDLFTSRWLGERSYQSALDEQNSGHEAVTRDPRAAVVFGLEHRDVITLGTRGEPLADLKVEAHKLASLGVELCQVDRGGQATLHSPGQLVIYPILPLRHWGIGARTYVTLLERTTAVALASYGVTSHTAADEPGLYTAGGKIAFFGVRIKSGVSMHGIAINVRNDLARFALIRSCGKSAERFARLADHVPEVTLEEVFSLWQRTFMRNICEKIQTRSESQLDVEVAQG